MVNQRQLLALIKHGPVAALQAPYKPKDADLFAVISAFEAQYASYAEFQTQMERYWCLRWLQQEQLREVDAVAIKDDLVRLKAAPLYIKVAGVPVGARGRALKIEILGFDEIDLSIQARFLSEETQTNPEAVLEGDGDDNDAAALQASDAVLLPTIEPLNDPLSAPNA